MSATGHSPVKDNQGHPSVSCVQQAKVEEESAGTSSNVEMTEADHLDQIEPAASGMDRNKASLDLKDKVQELPVSNNVEMTKADHLVQIEPSASHIDDNKASLDLKDLPTQVSDHLADTGQTEPMIDESGLLARDTTSNTSADSSHTEEKTSSTSQSLSCTVEQQAEYATQFLGFQPKTFVDSVYNATLEISANCLEAAFQFIKEQEPHLMSSEDIDNSFKSMMTAVAQKYDVYFDKLQIYVQRELMRVPDGVLLPEDEPQTLFTSDKEAGTRAEINMLTKSIHEELNFQSRLLDELESLSDVRDSIQTLETVRSKRKEIEKESLDVTQALKSSFPQAFPT